MDETTKQTIFIVDDDIFLLDLYAARFTNAGFIVESAQSGKEALLKLRERVAANTVPNVLLLDVVMPAMDGFELVEALNTEGICKESIKIFLTNLSREEDMIRGKALGAAGYIIKANSTPSEVVDEIKRILSTGGDVVKPDTLSTPEK